MLTGQRLPKRPRPPMSQAEITAWTLGVHIEHEVWTQAECSHRDERLGWENLTIEEQEARWALGDSVFIHWVLRGAEDALRERGG